MLTERSIINFLIWTVGLIAGPYLAIASLSGNFVPGLVVLGISFVVVVFAFLRDRMCVLPLIAYYCSGKFNFLPMKLAMTDLAALALLTYYLITYLAIRRKLMRSGSWIFAVPIIAIALIIMSDEPNFGVRFMGGTREGGRGSLFMAVAAVTYICGVSVNSPSPKFMSRIPVICIVCSVVSSIPYIMTTYVPSAAPYFYLFSDNINMSAYNTDVMNTEGLVRNQSQATVGSGIILCLLAYFPISTWLRPHRWWVPIVALTSLFLVIMGGYRSGLFVFAVSGFTLLWARLTWRAVLFVPPILISVAFLVTAHSSHLITLPASAQRTLAFLPGNWDPDIIGDTQGSNEFRMGIINVYNQEYAHTHPWLGGGLSFDIADFDRYGYMAQYHETPDKYFLYKQFITAKMFHTGYLSMYDSIGLVGSAFFIFLALALIFSLGRSVVGKSVDRNSLLFPVKAWLFAIITGHVVGFFAVFGDIKSEFPFFCYIAIAWFHLQYLDRKGFAKLPTVREVPFNAARAGMPVPA